MEKIMRSDWDIASKVFHQICPQLQLVIKECEDHFPELAEPIKKAEKILSETAGAVFISEIEKKKNIEELIKGFMQ